MNRLDQMISNTLNVRMDLGVHAQRKFKIELNLLRIKFSDFHDSQSFHGLIGESRSFVDLQMFLLPD